MTALMPENCWSKNRITPIRAPRKLSSSDRLTLEEWVLAASGLPPAGCCGDRVKEGGGLVVQAVVAESQLLVAWQLPSGC